MYALMQNRHTVTNRLGSLVEHLAGADKTLDETTRLHARALELTWVLYPDLTLPQQIKLLDDLINNRELICGHENH